MYTLEFPVSAQSRMYCAYDFLRYCTYDYIALTRRFNACVKYQRQEMSLDEVAGFKYRIQSTKYRVSYTHCMMKYTKTKELDHRKLLREIADREIYYNTTHGKVKHTLNNVLDQRICIQQYKSKNNNSINSHHDQTTIVHPL